MTAAKVQVALKPGQFTTFSGLVMNADGRNVPLEHINITDIAHSLAMQCRYCGHIDSFYSVAEHSCMCHDIAQELGYTQMFCFAALMHDAAEAYASDQIQPRRVLREMQGFNEIITRFERLVSEAFHIPWDVLQIGDVAWIDREMYIKESDTLRKACPCEYTSKLQLVASMELPCWAPNEAELQFIRRFTQCKNSLDLFAD